MVKRSYRLPRAEFRSEKYRIVRTPYFSLKTKANLLGRARIGTIVSTAVHKSAAKRNFWKRQAKAALLAAGRPGQDALLVLYPKTATLTRKKFKEAVGHAAAQAGA